MVSRNVSRRSRHGKETNLWFIIMEQQLSWSQKVLQRFNMRSKFYFRVHIAISLQWQKWFNWIIELKLIIIQFFLVVWWMSWYWSLKISLLLARKESLFCSRLHAWEGLDIQCLGCCCCRCRWTWIRTLEWVSIYCTNLENIKENTTTSPYLLFLFPVFCFVLFCFKFGE